MATAGGGVLLRELGHLSVSSPSSLAQRITISHEFLPSSRHVCASTNRGQCSWRARAAVSVQEVSTETISEGIAKEFLLENSGHEDANSHSSSYGVVDQPPDDDAPVRDKSMASYIESISALQEQRGNLGTNLGHAEGLAAVKALGKCYSRDVFTTEKRGSTTKAKKDQKRDKFISDPEKNAKRKTISLVRSIEALPLEIPVHSLLDQSELQFTTRESSFLLNGLTNPYKALEAFHWMHSNGKTRGNVYAYNIIFKILGARQDWSRIDALLSQMEEDGCRPDDYTFNTLIMSASKASYPDYAMKFFRMMVEKCVQPTNLSYSMMMLMYQKYGNVEEAEVVFAHMVQSGVQAVTAYSTMIALYTRGGLFEKSEQIMKEMRSNDVAPDRDNWLKQLNTYGQQGKIEEAEGVMDTMAKVGMILGVVGYNSMIAAYGKAGLYEKACQVLEKMKAEGFEPDAITYRCMTGACGRVGKLKDALKYFEEMKRLGIKPSSSNFCTLISLYGKAGSEAGIVRVIADMKKFGCTPDWQTLEAVVRAYDRAGQTKKVVQVLSLLRGSGWVEEPESYGTLLHVYLKCNLQKEALRIFYSMRNTGYAPKEYMCRSLICACRDAGMFEGAVAVFKEMQVAGVVPSLESACTMINVYGLKGDVKEAETLFESIQKLDVIVYNVMINVYMRFEMHEEAMRLYKFMEEEDHFLPDAYTYHSMLRICQKCNLQAQAEEIYWRLRNSGLELDEVMCNCVLRTCGRFLPLEEVHKVFQEMMSVGYVPNSSTFNVMIDLYGKAGMLERARQAFKEAQGLRLANMISFNTLINAYGKKQDFPSMEATLWEMQNAGYRGSSRAFNSMLDAYGKAGLYEKACQVLEKMKAEGFEPDAITYRCMTGACGRVGKLKDALKYFEEMKRLGIKPSSSNFCTLISLYGKAGSEAGIVRVIADMKKFGCTPDWQTLEAVVRAYDRAGQTKKVVQVLSLLRGSGWVEEPESYGTLLHVYLKCNLQKEALRIFYSMRNTGYAPKEYMCRSLICACRDAGMFEGAVAVFKEMQVAGVVPSLESACTMINVYGLKGDVKEAETLFESIQKLDVIVYNVMINVYMRFEMHEEAMRLYKFMEEEDHFLPDAYTYHFMLRICQKCNLQAQAEEIYWRLRNSGLELDEVMCNCVLRTCGRFLPLEEVHKVFQEMMSVGYVPNSSTFNVMIDLYGKAGMLERARQAFKEAQGLRLANMISFNTLINAYGKKQDFPSMEATLWEMQNAGYRGSSRAFNSMLDAYGKAGHLYKIEDVLARMEKSGFRMDLETYNILINIYGRIAMIPEMEDLFHRMQAEGFVPDRWTYNTLISSYGYADYPEKAVSVFKEMQDARITPDRITYIVLVAAFEKSENLLEAARWSIRMNQAGYTR